MQLHNPENIDITADLPHDVEGLSKFRRSIRAIYGSEEVVNPLQLVARLATLITFSVGSLGLASKITGTQEECFPNCAIDKDRITQIQQEYAKNLNTTTVATTNSMQTENTAIPESSTTQEPEPKLPDFMTVSFYGDSRGYFLAQGAFYVPGLIVQNLARNACQFLDIDQDIYYKKGPNLPVDHRKITEAPDGSMMACDTSEYIPGNIAETDLAIVFAGTQFTFDAGESKQDLHSPLDPDYQKYLKENLKLTLSRIPAKRIILLDTPMGIQPNGQWEGSPVANAKNSYSYDPVRIDTVDALLDEVAQETGAIFISNFSEYIASLPDSCQPDGIHLKEECATYAAEWIRKLLAENPRAVLGEGYFSLSGKV